MTKENNLQDGRDALLLSIEGNCSPSTVLELLIHGSNVNTTTKEGRTALMESVRLDGLVCSIFSIAIPISISIELIV